MKMLKKMAACGHEILVPEGYPIPQTCPRCMPYGEEEAIVTPPPEEEVEIEYIDFDDEGWEACCRRQERSRFNDPIRQKTRADYKTVVRRKIKKSSLFQYERKEGYKRIS